MRHACFGCDILVFQRLVTKQLQLFGRGYVQNMQARSGNSRQTDGQLGRCVTGRNGTDTGMGVDRNVIRSFVFLPVFLDIGFYRFLVFAMSGNQHVRTIEYFQQAVHFVHQHITGTGTHKQLNAANAMLVQLVKFRIVIVGCAEIAGVVDDTFLIQQVELGIQGIQRYGQRIGVGHIHDGSHPAGGSRTAFRQDIRFVGKAWVAKMHVVVDDAGQQVAACCIDYFFTRGGERFPVGENFGDASVFYHYRTLDRLSFVDNRRVVYQRSFHIFSFLSLDIYETSCPISAGLLRTRLLRKCCCSSWTFPVPG